jgi:signal transduction histidine kinase
VSSSVVPGLTEQTCRGSHRTPHRTAQRLGLEDAALRKERARIARELHDSVSQTLYAIALTAARARALLAPDQPRDVHEVLDDLLQLADSGQAELRAVLTEVRSDLPAHEWLTVGLANLAAEARARHGLDIRLSLTDEPDVPATTKNALVMIGREALHNVVKHACADRVDIVLEVLANDLVLQIVDNGRGFNPMVCRVGHFGLQSMRERAAAIGGTIELDTAEHAGTGVRARVPRICTA